MIAPLAALIRLHEMHCEAPSEDSAKGRNSERRRLLQSLDPHLIDLYMKVRNRHGISSVVPVERGICMGCYMRQPNIVEQVAEDVHRCQNCGRLTYDPEIAFELSVG